MIESSSCPLTSADRTMLFKPSCLHRPAIRDSELAIPPETTMYYRTRKIKPFGEVSSHGIA